MPRIPVSAYLHNICTFSHLNPQGRGFSKAMTTDEAKAYVGDVPCLVNTLEDDKLYLEPPSEYKVRMRNVGTSEPLNLKVGPDAML